MRKVGLDINRPIDLNTGQISPTVNPGLASKVAWVRVNFVLGPWPSPDDPAWRATYDDIVQRYLDRGIQVYGLIGHEAVSDEAGDNFRNDIENLAANAWIDRYVENFVTIVEHFSDRVKVFESFNEPNDWNDPIGVWQRAWIHSYWFAKMIGAIYRAVKLDGGFDDTTLITGPLFAHNINDVENENSIGSRYLQDTFRAGKEFHGWEDIRVAAGSYPLDGVGYHLYVDQGPEKTPDAISDTMGHYLDAISGVLSQEDGPASGKKIWVSEFGWQSHVVGEGKQADNLRVAFGVLRNDPRVGVAVWFSTQDFRPDPERPEVWNRFGLFPETSLEPVHAKLAYFALQEVAVAESAEFAVEPVHVPALAISLKGTVKTRVGTPIEGASVRLIGSEELLGDVSPAAVHRPGAVSWTRTITGFSGNRWNCWQKFVMNQVAGITWDEFRDQAVEHNPTLPDDGYVFKVNKSYKLPEQVTEQPLIAWTRTIARFSGNRWDCWRAFVQGKVDGITWDEFRDQVVEHNPTLPDDGYVFKADKTYVLPENILGPTEITWTRPLMGFSGNRWQCWEAHVRDQVQGLTWNEFMQAVVEHNPALRDDGYVFKSNKTYMLPENRTRPLYYLSASTDQAGRYAFEGLTTPGDYELLVEAPGYHPHRKRLSLEADAVQDVVLTSLESRMVSDWPGYATAPVKVRKLIDQALNMLGDDPVVFDSLSLELQKLATGFFHPDPDDFYHKDIVCADLVTICLHAAGVDYRWQVTEPPGTPYNTTYAANYYRPAPNHPKLREVADNEDWLPGDILIYWDGNLASERVRHVNLYVGPFSGTDLSGNVHPPSEGYDVVNASIDHLDPNGVEVGTAIRPVTKHFCLTDRFDYQHVQRMRHVDL
jgi:hypothetical protein